MLNDICKFAVVVPVYGNQESLEILYNRIVAVTSGIGVELTIQFVNDRSPDGSQAVMEALAQRDPRVGVLLLSKNHGSFTAIVAGLSQVAKHDAVVVLSADLQDPPEMIPEMVRLWREGNMVVLATRRSRKDGALSVFFADAFYRVYRAFVMKDMPKRGFDFFLIDKRVVNVILTSFEKNTSLIGLVLWAGFQRAVIEYDRCERPYGKSMWTFTKKLSYAFHSLVAFSSSPFKFMFYLGLLGTCFSVMSITYVLVAFWNNLISIPGWTSLIILQLITISALFISFGILGGYLWITLEHTRKRPLFIADKSIPAGRRIDLADSEHVEFFDIGRVTSEIQPSLAIASKRVLSAKQVILGPEVLNFEQRFASYIGVRFAVGVANGTDAITIALWAAGIRPGDKVIIPALSAVPTAVAVLRAGCIPVWADVDPESLLISTDAILSAAKQGAKAVVPVHLYGNVCDMDAICGLSEEYGLTIVEDCAQSTGSTRCGASCGTFSAASAFSFYPTKNLGAYGDGGAVLTNSEAMCAAVKEARFYGQNHSGECSGLGMNSRLDELQAALLLERMNCLTRHNQARLRIAEKYDKHLQPLFPVPRTEGAVPHLYVVRAEDREKFRGYLRDRGIHTGVHYPISLNRHEFLAKSSESAACAVAEEECRKIVSLPCYPNMPQSHVERVIEVCQSWTKVTD